MDIQSGFVIVLALAVAAGYLERRGSGRSRPPEELRAQHPSVRDAEQSSPEEAAPLRRRLALALLALEAVLGVPLVVLAVPVGLKLMRLRWLDIEALPLLALIVSTACAFTGVLAACSRHAWETVQGRRKAEPAYWYAALILLSFATCAVWLLALQIASSEIRPESS